MKSKNILHLKQNKIEFKNDKKIKKALKIFKKELNKDICK